MSGPAASKSGSPNSQLRQHYFRPLSCINALRIWLRTRASPRSWCSTCSGLVSAQKANAQLDIYPNPATRTVQLRLPASTGQSVQMQVTSADWTYGVRYTKTSFWADASQEAYDRRKRGADALKWSWTRASVRATYLFWVTSTMTLTKPWLRA